METLEEAKSYIRFLYEQLQDMKALLEEMRLDLKEARRQNEKKNESESRLLSNIERLVRDLSDSRTENDRLCAQNKVLLEEIQVLKKYRYGSPSQRNRRSKDAENKNVSEKTPRDRAEQRDGFDGTNGTRTV